MNHRIQKSVHRQQLPQPSLRLLPLLSALAFFTCHTPSPNPIEVQGLVGTNAPAFSLQDGREPNANPVALPTLLKKGPVVVIFHRGLHCPLCVDHLTSFADKIDAFKNAGAQV